MTGKPNFCAADGCEREIGPKAYFCRQCAIADVNDRHPYAEPCTSYAKQTAHHLDFVCTECGFDSAEHPGSGRVELRKITVGGRLTSWGERHAGMAGRHARPTAEAEERRSTDRAEARDVPTLEATLVRTEEARAEDVLDLDARVLPADDREAEAGAEAEAAADASATGNGDDHAPGRAPAMVRAAGPKVTWNASFPNRPCWTCGSRPIGHFTDGSPRYGCSHEPSTVSALFEWIDVPLRVTLTEAEIEIARKCGRKRLDDSIAKGLKDKLGVNAAWKHVQGATGEIAFARWAGLPFRCHTGRYAGTSDVGKVQVRAVDRSDYRLRVYPSDPGDMAVLLVLVKPTYCEMRGWIRAGAAKRPEWQEDPHGAGWRGFFVPTEALRDPAELRT